MANMQKKIIIHNEKNRTKITYSKIIFVKEEEGNQSNGHRNPLILHMDKIVLVNFKQYHSYVKWNFHVKYIHILKQLATASILMQKTVRRSFRYPR